jgi:hypothetical protein
MVPLSIMITAGREDVMMAINASVSLGSRVRDPAF